MQNQKTFLLALALSVSAFSSLQAAESQDVFKSAVSAAEAANAKAGRLKNQWTTTASTLKAAKTAASAGDYDKATALAKKAEALAKASIAQAQEQDKAWVDAVIH